VRSREIVLNQGKIALIDEEDYPRVAPYRWTACQTAQKNSNHRERWYVKRQVIVDGKPFSVWLHRFILAPPEGVTVDHIDGDGLNNQKANLRFASMRQQTLNRQQRHNAITPFKGVTKQRDSDRFSAHIAHEGKQRYLGLFRTAEEAARIFDAAARLLHGEFAWTNFPDIDPDAAAYVHATLVEGQRPARQRARSIFTSADLHRIRSDYAAGVMNQRELSEKYGCHYSTICRIINRSRCNEDVLDQVIGRAAN
jgi:hypothetical protein